MTLGAVSMFLSGANFVAIIMSLANRRYWLAGFNTFCMVLTGVTGLARLGLWGVAK